MSAATALPFFALRPQMTTPAAPRSANMRAIASPSPCVPPVTTATLPANCFFRFVVGMVASPVGWATRSVPTNRCESRVGTPLRGFAHPTTRSRTPPPRRPRSGGGGPSAHIRRAAPWPGPARPRPPPSPRSRCRSRARAKAWKSMKPSPGTVKTPSSTPLRKLMSFWRTCFSMSQPQVLAVDVVDAAAVLPRRLDHVAAGEGEVAGVEQQPDRLAGVAHQQVDLALRLDDRAHVVVVGHGHAVVGHPLGELGELPAIGGELGLRQPRARGERRVHLVLHACRWSRHRPSTGAPSAL